MIKTTGGEGGIRTPEAQLSTFLFSRQAHSTTLAPLQFINGFLIFFSLNHRSNFLLINITLNYELLL